MSSNAYSEIFLHIVWRTKEDLPFITDEMEKHLYKYIKHRCAEAHVFCYSIGGTVDHVHLCVSIPPTLTISEWIGELKGASAHYINQNIKPKSLQWQAGYGVVSFGKNNLGFVQKYIETQKENHSSRKLHNRLERIESDG